jgi:site-specific DNA recombinase
VSATVAPSSARSKKLFLASQLVSGTSKQAWQAAPKFAELLGRLIFDEEVLTWVRDALRASHADEKNEHEAAVGRLRAEYDRLQGRIHAMYVDKLDGKIDRTFFEQMSAEWRVEQDRCLREIERHQVAEQSYLEEGVRLLELARNARRLFEKQEPREKRRLLNFVVSNCTWKGGRLSVTLRQPFDFLEKTATTVAQVAALRGSGLARSEIWLPGPDSNQRPTG